MKHNSEAVNIVTRCYYRLLTNGNCNMTNITNMNDKGDIKTNCIHKNIHFTNIHEYLHSVHYLKFSKKF